MITIGSLVLYKSQLAIVSASSDGRITIETEAREQKKVREKDVLLLHKGPLKQLPPAMADHADFETAYEMLSADMKAEERTPVDWAELADLVYGTANAETIAQCARFARQSPLFELKDDGLYVISPESVAKIREKASKKQREAELRTQFIAALGKAIKTHATQEIIMQAEFAPFITELEAFACGMSSQSQIAREAGIAADQQAVHKALLDSGLWSAERNPWPQRAGCVLSPPRLAFPETEHPALKLPRKDLTSLESFAIDNAWSHDPDDAISIDGKTLWVHIADPAAFVIPNSDLDREALSRGATLYLPEKIVPMFPEKAMPILGLGLAPVSPALSFKLDINEAGNILNIDIIPSIIRVQRLSYEKADELIDSGNPALNALLQKSEIRHQRRLANGAVDIDFPEVSMKAGAEEIRFLKIPQTRSSAMVREMMLLAGEGIGFWAKEQNIPFIFASQDAPNISESILKSNSNPNALSIQYQRRRGMRASITGTEALSHRGLGLPLYSQVTSPLRRYQDLLAHYQIRAFLAKKAGLPEADAMLLREEDVAQRCIQAAQASAQTRQAERDSRMHWVCVWLMKNPGWKGLATVMDAGNRDALLFLHDFGIELQMRTRRQLELDSTIFVRATRINIPNHDFTLEEAEPV